MIRVVVISGSPSASSRTLRLLRYFGASLAKGGIEASYIDVRELPAEDLLFARASSAALAVPFDAIASAAGIVVGTPTYKAAYSGVLKTFLDVLPPRAFAGKVVAPLMTGGAAAHALALDYALRPVLMALGSSVVIGGLFVLDQHIVTRDDGSTAIDPGAEPQLTECARALTEALSGRVRHTIATIAARAPT
jgi:FMN reductase